MDYLDEEKYVKAQDEFKFVLSRGTGTDYGDDAQFFLAESYFYEQNYIKARDHYKIVLRKHPRTEFAKQARLKLRELRKL